MTEEIKRCYQMLDLEPGASMTEVKGAWRQLVKVWHPDRFGDDAKLRARGAAKIQQINRAYETLEAYFKRPPPPSSSANAASGSGHPRGREGAPEERAADGAEAESGRDGVGWGRWMKTGLIVTAVGALFIGLDIFREYRGEQRQAEVKRVFAARAKEIAAEQERARVAAGAAELLERQKNAADAKAAAQQQELLEVSSRLARLEQQTNAAALAVKASEEAKGRAAAAERARELLADAAAAAVAAEPKRVVPLPAPPGRAAVSASGERAVPLAAQRSLAAAGIEMIWIAGGTFSMGSTGGGSNEKPVTVVTLSPFWLAKTEVTQAQWGAVMGSNPSHFKGGQLPVENVSWYDAMEFCQKLTEQERQAGRLPAGTVYTLPTEAQWEYVCRAGTTGDYAGDLDAMAWYAKNSGTATHAVGTKQANAWGLLDMHGNVWEWCLDWYGPYSGGRVTDPRGAPSGTSRVFRGGGWRLEADYARSTFRDYYCPDDRDYDFGFRPARSSVP